ncbi:trypsin-like serine peptidase [Sphingomonas sp. XXL09]|uniref:trypsin-like serine peptidase n=1 Tax=Sphingomonas sp. XXL09 TaxID=3457787 RepID=UPI00406BCCCC
MRRRLAAIAALAVAAASPPAPANVFSADGTDPRRYLESRDPLWRRLLPVGQLTSEFAMQNKQGQDGFGSIMPGMGTTFLVSPCYAMTSYHVLFGTALVSYDPMARYAVRIRFGIDAKGSAAVMARGQVRVWDPAGPAAPDVALIRLDHCYGRDIGWLDLPLGLPSADAIPGVPLVMASISRDRSMRRLSVQQGCTIRAFDRRRGWLFHDCATREGASGAPLLAGTTVVGMNAGEFGATRRPLTRFEPAHANWAIAADWLTRSPTLRSLIAEDRARIANPLSQPAP